MIKLRFALPFIGLLLIAVGCENDASKKLKGERLKVVSSASKVLMNQSFSIKVNSEVDSVYFKNYQPVSKSGELVYDFSFSKPGSYRIEMIGLNGEKQLKGNVTVAVVSGIVPKQLQYTIEKTLDHEVANYTQGLELDGNILYESTGQYGESKVIKYAYPSFKKIKSVDLEQSYFGEGLTIVGDSIYQLTWQEGKAFIYDKELNKLGELPLPTSEGWGLAHNDNKLYITDGTGNIYTADKKLGVSEISQVYFGERAINSLNELEFVAGKVWANVYGADQIVRINPKTGVIDAFVDFADLRTKVTNAEAEVLNGIAYIPEEDAFLVTGKNWNKIFIVKLSE